MARLFALGFRDPLLDWIGTYLSDRKQIVRVKGFDLSPIHVTSGLLQGSHLSPLLFILFINDLSSTLQYCNSLLFVNDFKIFKVIRNIQDCFVRVLCHQNVLQYK